MCVSWFWRLQWFWLWWSALHRFSWQSRTLMSLRTNWFGLRKSMGRLALPQTQKQRISREQTGLDPNISWSDTGKIQLGNEVEVTLTTTVNIGLFGEFASFPVTLTAKASGTSEVYWK